MEEKSQCPNLVAALAEKITPQQREVCGFYLACPSFCDTPANWNTLTKYLPEEFDHELRWPTVEEMIAAFNRAKEAGHFRPN